MAKIWEQLGMARAARIRSTGRARAGARFSAGQKIGDGRRRSSRASTRSPPSPGCARSKKRRPPGRRRWWARPRPRPRPRRGRQRDLHRRVRQGGDARGPGALGRARQGRGQAAAHADRHRRARAAQHRGRHRRGLHARGDGRAQGGDRRQPAAAQAARAHLERHDPGGHGRGRQAGAGDAWPPTCRRARGCDDVWSTPTATWTTRSSTRTARR